MTWKAELFRSFFVAFGTMQTIANANYLLKQNGLELARKQHGELPASAGDKQIKTKVICMFLFGILFMTTGLSAFFTHTFYSKLYMAVLSLYCMYSLSEAIYYRYWKTTCAFIISAVICSIYIFL